ncbi:flagellar hook-associated protein FlgK [Spirochaeta thermophila DSM 6578]|uniref:Flagellar hook-associated protein 1 n=1 Tax=Winmispira thermophila (strain ATCC 700085 / DSM 6578 / Z-1203) TaxID=869211 RepID=G0GFX5_WINT7|nr:flagellar hook-associated protein FlgK [Spirochaeta thermophila]AEJ61668.1 flagellar hook-associated protein FlgK [Spirochaeta thermophila DSM 6578]
MHSTFMSIEIGKRGLLAHTQGLATVGHNMSNASVEGYSRQRVNFEAMDPLYMPGLNREETPGQIGQGVSIQSIERIRDEILEGRIAAQTNVGGYWETRNSYLLMVEKTYNEPSDVSVRSLLDAFWDAWQELSIHPDEVAARHAVIENAKALVDGIHGRYHALSSIRKMIEEDVQVTVNEVNDYIARIAHLNEQIVKVKAMGDNPNDLMDRRDLLVEKLAKLINITVDKRDPDEFTIHVGGRHLVQGKVYHPFILDPRPQNEGFSAVLWEGSTEEVRLEGGKLAALLELRDGDVRGEIQKLDTMTVNLVNLVNEVHRNAYGLNGQTGVDFFVEHPAVLNAVGNYDRNGDGEFDSTYLFRIHGTNVLDPNAQVGIEGVITLSGTEGDVQIAYYPTDTVQDIVNRINTSGAEVSASFDRLGRLVLKATPSGDVAFPDFVIRHVEDSGQFLSGYAGILGGSGPENAYDWETVDAVLTLRGGAEYGVAPFAHPSGWVVLNPEVERDPASVAAGFGQGGRPAPPGDGSAALAIANLRTEPVMIGRLMTFDDYFAEAVSEIGLKGQQAQIADETQKLIMKDLKDLRESISGVNIDEELAQMIKFQHGYAASARFISTFNSMLDLLINRMAV